MKKGFSFPLELALLYNDGLDLNGIFVNRSYLYLMFMYRVFVNFYG